MLPWRCKLVATATWKLTDPVFPLEAGRIKLEWECCVDFGIFRQTRLSTRLSEVYILNKGAKQTIQSSRIHLKKGQFICNERELIKLQISSGSFQNYKISDVTVWKSAHRQAGHRVCRCHLRGSATICSVKNLKKYWNKATIILAVFNYSSKKYLLSGGKWKDTSGLTTKGTLQTTVQVKANQAASLYMRQPPSQCSSTPIWSFLPLVLAGISCFYQLVKNCNLRALSGRCSEICDLLTWALLSEGSECLTALFWVQQDWERATKSDWTCESVSNRCSWKRALARQKEQPWWKHVWATKMEYRCRNENLSKSTFIAITTKNELTNAIGVVIG